MSVNSFDDYYMSFTPDLSDTTKPYYQALAEKLESDIRSGKLAPGTKLPPQRELADYLDINLSTVTRAFKICTQKGLIGATVGRGTYVSFDVNYDDVLLLNPMESHMIEMGAIFPSQEMNSVLVEETKEMMSEPGAAAMFQYGSPEGTLWQKNMAQKWLGYSKCRVDAEQILFSNGGQNAIMAAVSGIFHWGDKIACEEVTYPGMKTVAKQLGIQLVPIRTSHYEMNPEALEYACKSDNIKGIYLMPDYHNPTAHIMSTKTRKAIAALAIKYHLYIIEDAINTLLCDKITAPVFSHAPENTVYISSLSKTIAPGIRIAFLAMPQPLQESIAHALYSTNIAVSPLSLQLAARMIQSEKAMQIVNARKEKIHQRNAVFDQVFSGLPALGDSGCPFRWLLLPDSIENTMFERLAKAAHVQIYASSRFSVGNADYPNAARISVVSEEEDDSFAKGLHILKEILEDKSDKMYFY